MTLTVATAQLASVGDVEADLRAAVSAVAQADGADLLVLPELFLGGYQLPPVVVSEADPRLDVLEQAAAAAGLVVLVGACLDGPDGFTISLLELGRGTRRVYDKQNPCNEESRFVVPGRSSVIIDVNGWSVGLGICYDGCFPEHARALALAGADVYVASIAYLTGSAHRRDVYYRARAVENGMYVVVSGLVGECGGQRFDGGSAVYDAEGRTLAEVGTGEGVAVARLEREPMEATRRAHSMLADVREPGPLERR